jgi:hypothetical protein
MHLEEPRGRKGTVRTKAIKAITAFLGLFMLTPGTVKFFEPSDSFRRSHGKTQNHYI